MTTVKILGIFFARKLCSVFNHFCSSKEILSNKGMVVCTVRIYERKVNLLPHCTRKVDFFGIPLYAYL